MPPKFLRSLFMRKIVIAEWELNIMAIFILLVGVVAGSLFTLSHFFPKIFAAGDVNYVWDFSVPGDYVVSDANQIDVTGSGASLKVRNYTTDANTALLLHLDESSGSTADDSSSNNNDADITGGTWTAANLNNGLSLNGTNEYGTAPDSSSLSFSQANTLEAWTKFDATFGAATHSQRQGVLDKGAYQLYYDNETGKIVYELADASATTWTQAGGNNLNGGWGIDGQRDTESMTIMGSNVYVGLGDGTGDAEVWMWNGTIWTKIGGDALNNSWAINTFESVYSLINDGTNIYAGLGATSGDGEIWKWNGTSWTKIAGDAQYNSWPVNRNEGVYTMLYQNNILYAGLGISTDDAEVWACSTCATGTPDWTQIGGDSGNNGINGSWTGLDNMETVFSMTGDGTNVYAGLGLTANDAEVWRWNGTGWTKIGGDAVNSSWGSGYEYVLSLVYSGSNLYAGLGTTAGDAEVWRWNGSTWLQVGGDSFNGSWGAGYEGVYRMVTDGTNIYAGLGLTAGDNEVWQCSSCATSPSWTQIGGDGIDSSFTNTHTVVNDLAYANSTLYAGIQTTSAQYSSQVWTYRTTDSPKWTQIAGNYVNKSWGFRGMNDVEVMNVSGDKLYAGTGYQYTGNALVWEFDGSTWTLIGGQGINNSWANNTYERVSSMISHNGELYVGTGVTANDAEVWYWNGSTWLQIGGDSLNSGWTTNYEEVTSLSSYNGFLFAGLGNSSGDAEIWRWNGSTWFKVAGDNVYSGWNTGYEQVLSLSPYNGKLYAGTGNSNGDAEIWECTNCDGTPSWSKVGGDGVLGSWSTSPVDTYNNVDSLVVYNNLLVAGLGTAAGEAAVYTFDAGTSTWTQIGGDDINSSWATGTYERVRTTVVYNGDLYAGLGNSTGDGEVWKWNGTDWEQIGGDSLNSGWASTIEEINAFSIYKGKLYTGTGNTANADAAVWAYGNNAVLTSNTVGQNTSWHHIAGTYDGTTMRLYIDGTLDNSLAVTRSIPDTTHDLLIGTTYAGREFGKPQGFFQGTLDEIRVSTTARSSFVTSPYASSAQTVRPATSVFTEDIKNWEDFNETNTAGLGTITYRLSANNGSTWQYWNGSSWTTSSSTAQANDATTMTNNIDTFTVGSNGIMWQAILVGNGNEAVTLDQVEITATSDTTDPTPPNSLTALSQSGGTAITTATWYPHSGPYFSWSGATDTGGSGVNGYFVYFGTDNSADPQTAGTFQSGSTYTASSLTSGQTYYLRIRSRDVAQNVSSIWDAFTYQYDNSAPNNPSGLSVSPSGYSGENEFTFFWSTVGTDIGSG
ncbi:LamG domain-containing protein, partial [candidate division WWE3 bacterium]|nr:LamG domain-containing protein [candidate division WWE3 bacterium]